MLFRCIYRSRSGWRDRRRVRVKHVDVAPLRAGAL